ncbi:hypothetical protein NBRC3299_2475 [Acetobacter pasteurianus NBRC 3299]|nr:hypothetical protein NBRC3299_2475 [Acetobacter pasteurianus NBRC 3299]
MQADKIFPRPFISGGERCGISVIHRHRGKEELPFYARLF